MHTLQVVFMTLLALAVVVVLSVAGFVYAGVYNVAATEKHWPATQRLIRVAQKRSIALRAGEIGAPGLGGRQQLLEGAAAYDDMCARCHTPPGGDDTQVAQGLYPAPPDMAQIARGYSEAEIFWVIKYGIKMTGMPAWGPTHADRELWPIVAFVLQAPHLEAEDYRRLVETARAEGVGHHGGDEASSDYDHAGHEH